MDHRITARPNVTWASLPWDPSFSLDQASSSPLGLGLLGLPSLLPSWPHPYVHLTNSLGSSLSYPPSCLDSPAPGLLAVGAMAHHESQQTIVSCWEATTVSLPVLRTPLFHKEETAIRPVSAPTPSLFSELSQSLTHAPSLRPTLYEKFHIPGVSPRTLLITVTYCQMPSQGYAGWAIAQLVECLGPWFPTPASYLQA